MEDALFILICLATSAISITVTKSPIFKVFRDFFGDDSWAKKLFTCPYCFSHWVSFMFSLIYMEEFTFNPLLMTMAFVGGSAITTGVIATLLGIPKE